MIVYLDMDGVLAEFDPTAGPDVWTAKGYFANRPPQIGIINAAKALLKMGFVVKVLSAVLDEERIKEKNYWLDKFLPEIPEENRVYVPYGSNKSDYVDINEDDILLDDYSVNLHSWRGIGIKCKNGINGTKGTWRGYEISTRQEPTVIANTIAAISRLKIA